MNADRAAGTSRQAVIASTLNLNEGHRKTRRGPAMADR